MDKDDDVIVILIDRIIAFDKVYIALLLNTMLYTVDVLDDGAM